MDPKSVELFAVRNAEPGDLAVTHSVGLDDDDLKAQRDIFHLARVGKRSVLKRTFGFLPSLGFSCTLLITWEGALILFSQSLNNGGPAGTIYGFILVWIGTLSVFSTLSELVSMAPVSSGQYHWAAMLAPPSWQKFMSYMAGWLTALGWQAEAAAGGFLGGTLIQGLIVLANPNYDFQAWHGTLLYCAIIIFSVVVNSAFSTALPKFEAVILILHLIGFFALMIPLVVLGPHDSADNVFKTFINSGNWPTNGLSFFIGLSGNVFAFLGADGAIHMSEEIHDAAMVVPRSMFMAININGVLGFAMLIAVLFCLGDSQAALSTNTDYPFLEIFYQAVQSTVGATIMGAVVATLSCCATVVTVTTASRTLWSFSRDHGVPFSRFVFKLDKRTSIPVNSIIITAIVSCLLSLINIGSSTAFNDIVSLTVSTLYISYLMVCSLMLWRRCRGDIVLMGESSTELANTKGAQLTWGPWRVPGILGIVNNAFACVFLVIILFFSFWPSTTPVVASTMNYSVLMLGAVLIFSVVYWFIWARKIYGGPIVETRPRRVNDSVTPYDLSI